MTHVEDQLTPRLGLVKPAAASLVDLILHFDDNWDILESRLGDFDEVWVAFTPTWGSVSNPQPAIGNGTFVATMLKSGSFFIAKYVLTAGGTTTFGTGNWTFSFPSGVINTLMLGNLHLIDSSAGLHFPGIITPDTTGAGFRLVHNGGEVNSASPFVWASGDTVRATVFGEQVI